MFFKILFMGKAIHDIKKDPGHFVAGETRNAMLSILFMPALIIFLGLVFLFSLGFTHFLGGPYLFFKIIFWIGFFISLISGFVIYKLTSFLHRKTKTIVNKTIDNISNIDNNSDKIEQ